MMLRQRRAIFKTSANRNRSFPSSTADAVSRRDVGSRSHGDADVGFEQRGSIVDAVAEHDNVVALEPKIPHPFHFLFGKQLGPNFVNSQSRAMASPISLRSP